MVIKHCDDDDLALLVFCFVVGNNMGDTTVVETLLWKKVNILHAIVLNSSYISHMHMKLY